MIGLGLPLVKLSSPVADCPIRSKFHQTPALLPTTGLYFIAVGLRGFRLPERALGQRAYVIRVFGPIQGHRAIYGHEPVKPSAINSPFQVNWIGSGH